MGLEGLLQCLDQLVPLTLENFFRDLIPTRCAVIPLRFLNEALAWGGYRGGTFQPFVLSAEEYGVLIANLVDDDWFTDQRPTPEWIRNAGEWLAWNGVCTQETIEALRAIQPAYDAMVATGMSRDSLKRYADVQDRFRALLQRDDPSSPLLEQRH